jgi:hypothetical protein
LPAAEKQIYKIAIIRAFEGVNVILIRARGVLTAGRMLIRQEIPACLPIRAARAMLFKLLTFALITVAKRATQKQSRHAQVVCIIVFESRI